MAELGIYAGLFVVALLAATVIPMQSEAALAGLLLLNEQPAGLLILAASAGNILGSCLNWLLGRYVERFRNRPWFPLSEAALDRAQAWYHRYGRWSLLLSWVPIIGDPLTVAAGILKEPLPTFLLIVAFAKVARYLVLAAVVLGVFS